MSKKLRLLISFGLLAAFAWHTDVDVPAVLRAFAAMQWPWWFAALGLLLACHGLTAWRWQILARPLGFQRTVPELLRFSMVGMFFNLLLPTSIGGDVVRAWYLDGRSGRRRAALAAVFLDRFSGLLVLLGLSCVALHVSSVQLPPWIVAFVWGAVGCGLLGIVGLPWLLRRFGKVSPSLQRARAALKTLRAPRVLAASTVLSLGVQAGSVAIVWILALAMGVSVPLDYWCIVVPMVTLLTMLPVSTNGMGVREWAMKLFLAPAGVGENMAVSLALLWFSIFLAGSMLGGLVYLFGRLEPPPAAMDLDSQAEGDYGPVGSDPNQGRTRQHRAAA